MSIISVNNCRILHANHCHNYHVWVRECQGRAKMFSFIALTFKQLGIVIMFRCKYWLKQKNMPWNQSSIQTHTHTHSSNQSITSHLLIRCTHSLFSVFFFCREHAPLGEWVINFFRVPHEHYFVSKREKVEMKNCNSCWRHSRCCLSNDKNEFFSIDRKF